MAATALYLLELSIFLLITAAATTAQTTDPVSTKCFVGNGGDQLELARALQIKKSLVQDLIAKVMVRPEPYYCNELTLDGLKMYGYGDCLGRDKYGVAGRTACTDCLDRVGNVLIDGCGQTATGSAFDVNLVCFFGVDYNIDVCPEGSY